MKYPYRPPLHLHNNWNGKQCYYNCPYRKLISKWYAIDTDDNNTIIIFIFNWLDFCMALFYLFFLFLFMFALTFHCIIFLFGSEKWFWSICSIVFCLYIVFLYNPPLKCFFLFYIDLFVGLSKQLTFSFLWVWII